MPLPLMDLTDLVSGGKRGFARVKGRGLVSTLDNSQSVGGNEIDGVASVSSLHGLLHCSSPAHRVAVQRSRPEGGNTS